MAVLERPGGDSRSVNNCTGGLRDALLPSWARGVILSANIPADILRCAVEKDANSPLLQMLQCQCAAVLPPAWQGECVLAVSVRVRPFSELQMITRE